MEWVLQVQDILGRWKLVQMMKLGKNKAPTNVSEMVNSCFKLICIGLERFSVNYLNVVLDIFNSTFEFLMLQPGQRDFIYI